MRVRLRIILICYVCLTLLFCSGAAFRPDYGDDPAISTEEPQEIKQGENDVEPEAVPDPEAFPGSQEGTKPSSLTEPEAMPETERVTGKSQEDPSVQTDTSTQEELSDSEKESSKTDEEKESEKQADKDAASEIIYDSDGEILKKKVKGIWYIWDDDYGYREEVRLALDHKVDTESVKEEKARINLTCIYQRPELPTGCEITSAYMILKYYRFPISKVRFANKYFEVKEKKTDFRYSFVGDPYSEYGLGCYAPAVVLAFNRYFDVCESDMRAFNYTGYTFESLLNEVAMGNPVVIWGTQYMKEPFYGSYFSCGDDVIRWISQEHCMVLGGYDLKRKTVYIYDPLAGPVEYDMDLFKKRFLQLGSQAVIVRDRNEFYDRRNQPSAFRYDPNLPKYE